MKNSVLILSLTMLTQPVFVIDANAMRTAHRPWLARETHITTPALESERTSVYNVNRSEENRHLTGRPHKGERIAQQASRYKGVKYRFGGDTKSKGFDCSGLVKRIYDDLHLERVPHNSVGLYRMGRPIHLNELRPGDLVFFKNTYRRGISHVGVYAGNNRFIHAQNRRHGVTVTALSEPYYQLHYAGARRLY